MAHGEALEKLPGLLAQRVVGSLAVNRPRNEGEALPVCGDEVACNRVTAVAQQEEGGKQVRLQKISHSIV